MRIESLEVKNFRSYFGHHTLDLTPVQGSQLVLVFGENMSGKTGLFLALNWCLYGQALGRQGEDIPIFVPGANEMNYLINAMAVENGEYEMLARLTMTHEGEQWTLERLARCAGDPLSNDPFAESSYLRIGERQLHRQEIREQVSHLLHQEAAQFYFFDGELLAQYERWLEDPEQREARVRQAVERTVGTAALRLYSEIEAVAQDAEHEQRRALVRSRREENLVRDLEQKLLRIREVEDEVTAYDDEIQRLEHEAARIAREHGELADFVAEQGRLEEIARQIDAARDDTRLNEAAMRSLLHATYWLPLNGRAASHYVSLFQQLQKVISAPTEEVRAQLLRESLDTRECKVCCRALDGTARAQLQALQNQETLASISRPTVEYVSDLVNRVAAIDEYRTTGQLQLLRGHEDALLESRSRRVHLEDEDRRIRELHGGRPRGTDREQQMERLKAISEQLGRTRDKRREALEDIERLRGEATGLQGRANRITSDPSIQVAARVSRLAVEVFERAIQPFREAARRKVEEGATDVFRQLVTEPGYAGIQIDEAYRLQTVDQEGNGLPIPSAGGQQLVTLALIGGLNLAAVHGAPIVMDTPAGRIDRPNRERILRWVAAMDRQVVLMVHSGELEPSEVASMGVDVGRAYRIHKLSPKSSEIAPLDAREMLR